MEDVAKLVLRLTIGGLVLLHGIHKLLTGIDGIGQMVSAHHLPGWIAYLVYLGEVVGPALAILGVFTRVGAGLIAVDMLVAIWLVHMGSLFALNAMGGYQLELQACYLFGALTIVLMGAGPLSLGGRNGSLN